ncbi:amino acid adenylation domain-containing protein [Pseudomonas vanderleydeniana]|uniref:Amino acid adenylation domain-containing protein n=1 Tax=Pseudomonas vanderleydeniana TaxID=2745495 RepID=A0A9E6TVG1_9PSED|nr:non-ribosomal peptide synthetase [Pseudomonas vanderleydeniana]QXI31601.1 amino acid adenylation domain-containing protein [Pseudomonas vanderleydeniana]
MQRKGLATLLKQKGINLFEIAPVFKRAADEPLRLSYAQQRQWFLWQWAPHSAAYNIAMALRLQGRLDVTALQGSLQALVARHEPLRTVFTETDGQPLQVVLPSGAFELPVERLAAGEGDARVQAFVLEHSQAPFDLRKGPLMRAALLRVADDEHVLVLTLHHIVADGWSLQVMIEELVQCYQSLSQGLPLEWPALPIQYADYALWQRHWMEAGEQERQLAYWQQALGGEQPVLELPTDHPRPVSRSFAGASCNLTLDLALSDGLKALARRESVSLFSVLLASFQALLHRYSGQADIRVGVPVANRERPEVERLIGFFVNTQVLKAEVDGQQSFEQLLHQVWLTVQEAQAHQDLPFEQLVEALEPGRNLSHSPLFQVMFNHQAQSRLKSGTDLDGLRIEPLQWQSQTAQFDLVLDTHEQPHGIEAVFKYATDLFEPATVEALLQHWASLLRAIVSDPRQRIAELPLLDATQQQQVLARWNPAPQVHPVGRCLHQLIEEQAERHPDAVAVLCAGERLTYAELNTRANRWAHRLIARGVGADVLVGVAAERSLEMIVALLAVLKAGGAYVPLDPTYPEERLRYMITDSGLKLLLAQGHLLERLPVPLDVECLDLGATDVEGRQDNPLARVDVDNLAYVIYTSGSTGKPKGALLPHRNVLRLFDATQHWFGFDSQDSWTLFHSYAFDFSVWEIFGALLHGGRLVVVPHEVSRSPEAFHALLCEERVTVLNQTPSAFKSLMAVALASPRELALRQVIFGGEALEVQSLRPWFERFGEHSPTLVNMYGITETTVHVTYRPLSLADLDQAAGSPIGEPIVDLSWYLLDDALNLTPTGCIGELYVAGAGLARGYLNQAGLTATRFVANPFDPQGGRLYRTGDLARMRSDGVIDYIGRRDQQVKIRGFRIELGEIESRLQAHDQVREAAVLALDGQLVAYLVASDATLLADAERQAALRVALRDDLKLHLADYMVPAHLMLLPALPLTANGKLDRKALPAPDTALLQQAYVAPRSALEQQLAAIWSEVLKVERVGLGDNFFELGGHSLLATQVIARARQALGIDVELRSLFETRDLAAFAASAGQGDGTFAPAFVAADRQAPLRLSYAQQRQWFLWQLEPDNSAYHIPAALALNGRLDAPALRRSFEALVARHESLRTTFAQQDGEAVQVVHPVASFELPIELLEGADSASLAARIDHEVLAPFDLQQGPLLRARLFRLGEERHVLVVTLHHIVSDGWSMPIMVDELIEAYVAFSQGQSPQSRPLPFQYADYAQWQRDWMEAGEQARQLAYWRDQLGSDQPVLELPTDRPRPSLQSHAGARTQVELDRALVEGLKGMARRQGVTLFMLLLASFQALLHRHSGQNDIRVGVPVANRSRVETEGLIGFFVNTQVLRAEFDLHTRFDQLLQQVKQAVLGAQAHQDLPFEHLVQALQPERSLSHSPLFQVMYNHQTELKGAVRPLPGLEIEALDSGSPTAQFDLTLDTFESEDGLRAALTYATALFDADTIERLAGHWRNLLQALVSGGVEQAVAELPLLDARETQRVLQDWSRIEGHYPAEQCVHELIEAQARRTPDAVALVFGELQMSYRELDGQANRLAHKLRDMGVGPEVAVGIAVDRGLDMVVGLLAILKAGGAYVPLDPEFPEDRLAYMMQDSGIRLLLSHSPLLAQLPVPAGLPVLCLDQAADWLRGYDEQPLPGLARLHNLAYVIYTSGSTGKPKGVAIEHHALSAHCPVAIEYFRLVPQDRVLLFSTLNFDGFVEQLFPALCRGAGVVVRGNEVWDSTTFQREVLRSGITVADLSTAYWYLLAQDFCRLGLRDFGALRQVSATGEAMPAEGINLWKQAGLEHIRLLNTYGPTETTITASYLECAPYVRGELPRPVLMPIGRPLGARRMYILDAAFNPAVQGGNGELLIGGALLARGYHQRPALTAERFIPDPFDEQGGGRLYRTGDVTRYRDGGLIEYVGRIDHQVKIRGFRIELGEIEARLQEHAQVREALVIDIDGPSGKQLAAYLVPHDPALATADAATRQALRGQLRDYLKAGLPDYMVPAHLLVLAQMPMTPNGKLDRKALPKPDPSLWQQDYVAPRNEREQQLAAIWAEVLQVERVGLHDNFFELGGHSLLAAQVISRIHSSLGVDIPLRLIFEKPQLNEFSQAFEDAGLALTDDGLSDIERMMNEMAEA